MVFSIQFHPRTNAHALGNMVPANLDYVYDVNAGIPGRNHR
jgi:hypothetical protein